MKTKSTNQTTSNSTTDLQKLIVDFESITHDLSELALSDKEERELIEEKRKELETLSKEVDGILAGNERSRREKLIKLYNIQELLHPILWATNSTQSEEMPLSNH